MLKVATHEMILPNPIVREVGWNKRAAGAPGGSLSLNRAIERALAPAARPEAIGASTFFTPPVKKWRRTLASGPILA
jgi:hypothetical protein